MSFALFNDPSSLAPQRAIREDLPGGGFLLRHPEPLQPYARCIGAWLDHWALTTPETLFLAERDTSGDWRKLSYRDTRRLVGGLAQALLDMALPAGAPIVVLSDNSIDHALLLLAGMHVGRPVCTISSAYCRLTRDYSKVHGMLDSLRPALVYAAEPGVYGPAMASWSGSAPRLFSQHADQVPGALAFAVFAGTQETPAVQAAHDAVRPDDHAKYLLTSGSTGLPKVVINTHRMLTANQQQIAQVWPFLNRHRLTLLDWLPWSHTFGANHNFHMVLAHGGSLYIDEGRPAPGMIDKTVRNLREVQPNFYFNVPRGFDMLLPYLEQDDNFAHAFFDQLEAVFYAGAALPQSIWERLEGVARRTRSRPVWFTSAWGATETSPSLTAVHWPIERAGCIGAPLPGVELKFVPNGGKLEMRVRGPNVFPGYRDAPEQSAKAFDEQGYYLIGDAGRLMDEQRPEAGVAFDGRVAEDFKLMSGTWVSVGTLRLRAVTALTPLAADVVVTGHDREEVGLLVFPSPAAKALAPGVLAERLRSALQSLRNEGGGSSQTPLRARVLDDAPNADAGEITDKGYINQGAVLRRRAAEVMALYSNVPDERTVRL
ncbi:feruloyl-CoA synthase [Aquabacterium sp.]|uniref:feruloyl-CoA synthase n=1 Tax=Aquabacterium sp. TaxID=1872578 RepID=UPI002CCB9AD3|nr:feruloyl-CoA synthase [Aquabacterium sp.]HSW04564.1 feruloyl-CoA synthase [Aquabacterium sp.]